MTRIVEILMYTLKPGSGSDFHRIMQEASVPLHLKAGMDVVSYGGSLHDDDSYHLIRSYESESHRLASQDIFYASTAWRHGPRADIISRIEVRKKGDRFIFCAHQYHQYRKINPSPFSSSRPDTYSRVYEPQVWLLGVPD